MMETTTNMDALDQLIVDRLGERQKKIDRMAEMEQAHKTVPFYRRRTTWMTVVAAACLAGVLFLTPLLRSSANPLDELGIGVPDLTEYRAGIPSVAEIQRLMQEEKWEEALVGVEKALKNSDSNLELLLEAAHIYADDEGVVYEAQAEQSVNSELRWTYIYLLVKTNHSKEAQTELARYLKLEDFCEHREDAQKLLSAIQ